MVTRTSTATLLLMAVLVCGSGAACKKSTESVDTAKHAPTATTPAGDQPARGPSTASAPEGNGLTTLPAEPPASRAVATAPVKPESTYSSEPPYPVHLYVLDPSEEQPGWLRVEELIDPKQVAELTGTFPERNKLYVDTVNVRRLRIHIGHLPLAERRRIVLQLDKRGMELIRKDREYVILELRPTGVWESVEEEK